ncbi:MAG: cobalamin biosynthesis protein, partial [Acidimicrobiia bacterium]
WASARLDDLMNWVPARLTALLVAAVRPSRAGAVARAVRRDAPAHPSPNAGVAEAAFAAALGLGLGGETRYPGRVELRPVLGEGRDPEPADIDAAVELLDDVTAALAAALAAGAALTGGLALLGRRRRRS